MRVFDNWVAKSPNVIHIPLVHKMLVESRHSAVVSETATHSIVDGLSLLNSCPLLQLYVTFEPSGHDVASVELLLPLDITGTSPQYNTTICNIDISVSSVSTYNQHIKNDNIIFLMLDITG